MFEQYRDIQPKFYEEITTSVKNNRVSHAYLIETKSFGKGKDLAISFAKFLLCSKHLTVDSECKNCNICNLIDNGSFSNLIIIEPDGMWIKKEQLLNLKKNFSEKSVNDTYQIYIINGADKLNEASANSLLKFLEEPEEGIIAILLTENRYNVLQTILSRCQVYSLKEEHYSITDDYADLLDFLVNIERKGNEIICYTNDMWFSKYKTKEDFINAFIKMEFLFTEILNYKVKNICSLDDNISDIKYISDNNNIFDITRKISLISKIKSEIKYNLNLSLLIDKFIIDYVGGD